MSPELMGLAVVGNLVINTAKFGWELWKEHRPKKRREEDPPPGDKDEPPAAAA